MSTRNKVKNWEPARSREIRRHPRAEREREGRSLNQRAISAACDRFLASRGLPPAPGSRHIIFASAQEGD